MQSIQFLVRGFFRLAEDCLLPVYSHSGSGERENFSLIQSESLNYPLITYLYIQQHWVLGFQCMSFRGIQFHLQKSSASSHEMWGQGTEINMVFTLLVLLLRQVFVSHLLSASMTLAE